MIYRSDLTSSIVYQWRGDGTRMNKFRGISERFMRSILPRRVYLFLWAIKVCAININKLIGKSGMFRSAANWKCLDGRGRVIPFITYPAVAFLDRLDLSEKSVFEFGAGCSTEYWSRRANRVVSVESDKVWFKTVSRNILSNATLLFFESMTKYVSALQDAFDIILIDGDYRLACAKVAATKINNGGMIIVDNADDKGLGFEPAEYLSGLGFRRVDFVGFTPIIHNDNTTSFFWKQ